MEGWMYYYGGAGPLWGAGTLRKTNCKFSGRPAEHWASLGITGRHTKTGWWNETEWIFAEEHDCGGAGRIAVWIRHGGDCGRDARAESAFLAFRLGIGSDGFFGAGG